MLGTVPGGARAVFRDTTAASTTPGTSITAGAAHTKGTAVQLGADLTEPLVGFWLVVETVGTVSATDNRALLDIQVDLAGGTSWSDLIANMNIGHAKVALQAALFYIPIRVPSGAALAARCQAATASKQHFVQIHGVGEGDSPWQQWSAVVCDTLGADTAASEGTAITTGNQGASGAEGTWVAVGGAVTRDYRAIMLDIGVDTADTTVNARGYALDIGMDVDGGSAFVPIVENLFYELGSNETQESQPVGVGGFIPAEVQIPEGATLAVRVSSSGTAVDALSAILHCFA